ncbi:MAG: aminotransferase class I/II-fold pyridoxal phosphate-dependent enzyme [Acidobacteria bacterium]|nr:MAG: aminotransferase class I/II-fold pyridoxal phosphate-dependent enzyme [Acidobacteriota bacterium]
MDQRTEKMGPSTLAIHGGRPLTEGAHALSMPLYLTSSFVFQSAQEGAELFAHEKEGFIYTRMGNPTVEATASKIAALEGAEEALLTGSGMAAISTTLCALLQPGQQLIAGRVLYGSTLTLLKRMERRCGMNIRYVDVTNLDEVRDALHLSTQVVYIETPDNPLLGVADIAGIAALAKKVGALLIVDNTFATPFNQRPLALGADLVIHSATKYLSGHGDLIAGAVVGSRPLVSAVREELKEKGAICGPFTAWLLQRGLKTFALRMERHNANGLAVARFLEQHPRVERVHYPGLPSSPHHALARQQMKGFGGVLSFEVSGGLEAGMRLVNAVTLCTRAVSLGDAETLIEHPASMTHATVPPEQRRAAGITDGLVRLAVGLEDPEDIIADLDRALAACC